ncbi:MAG TPA: LacI family DNA-binding transcriptional regulator [Pseudonocardiaceae bacterium]|nr:LacI family DNA-binding transcriptional regulator [Pseudonocardiaceae bacterium]
MTARKVRLADVAAAAGTSTKTASRVLNGDTRVAEETRTRVEAAIAELDYRPDPLARSLRKGTDETIGVVVDSIADPFFATVTGEIEKAAFARGMTVTVASTGRSADRERLLLDGMTRRRVAGVIVVPASTDHEYLRGVSCSLVFVDREAVGLDVDSVLVDDYLGARMAVRHLIEQGHRRIALLSDAPVLQTTARRLAGYRAELAEAGISVPEELVQANCPDIPDAAARTAELLRMAEPPTAIFSSNIRCSMGVAPVLHSLSRTDVALVCFGDFFMADALQPAVTVIDHRPEVIGQLAADRLFHRLSGASEPATRIEAPLHLVRRGSGELRP